MKNGREEEENMKVEEEEEEERGHRVCTEGQEPADSVR